jgi:hypothetical protein
VARATLDLARVAAVAVALADGADVTIQAGGCAASTASTEAPASNRASIVAIFCIGTPCVFFDANAAALCRHLV